MKILSHRGYWRTPEEKNQLIAFDRSFSLGFGTETDFRDCDGELVVSHDVPKQGALKAGEFFDLLVSKGVDLPIAINVKSDGLQRLIYNAIQKYSLHNYFLFDMSIPDAVQSIKYGLKSFTRQSEYEKDPALYELSCGVWMDAFQDDSWITEKSIGDHLRNGKSVCIVSPELHGRTHLDLWDRLNAFSLLRDERIMLCTDLPEDARDHFGDE